MNGNDHFSYRFRDLSQKKADITKLDSDALIKDLENKLAYFNDLEIAKNIDVDLYFKANQTLFRNIESSIKNIINRLIFQSKHLTDLNKDIVKLENDIKVYQMRTYEKEETLVLAEQLEAEIWLLIDFNKKTENNLRTLFTSINTMLEGFDEKIKNDQMMEQAVRKEKMSSAFIITSRKLDNNSEKRKQLMENALKYIKTTSKQIKAT